jgi:hypothetical protein
MRSSPTDGRAQGPFVLPARVLLLAAGVLAVGLASVNLYPERHSTNVDIYYVVVAGLIYLIWLASLVLAWRGLRIGVFLAGLIAFIEFGVIAAGHFVSAPYDIHLLSLHEGLWTAPVLMAILPACALTAMAATVSWSHPTGRRRLQTLPLLIVAVLGTILVILYSTDSLRRGDFGTANAEDATFGAAMTASLWLVGGLWIARLRRLGALIIMLATFIIWYSFVSLHLLKGGTSLTTVASKSGVIWAGFGAGAAILAAASFLVALTLLGVALVQRRRANSPRSAPAARPARG